MSIELQYKWSKEEFLKASHAEFKRRARTVTYRLIGLGGIVLAASAILSIYEQDYSVGNLVILVLAFYWFALRWPVQRFMASRLFSKHAEKDTDLHWSIDELGFKGGGSKSHGEFSWDTVTKVVKYEEGFLVYKYPVRFWFPLSAFKSPEDINWFEQIAAQKAKEYVAT
jgi:hypothetical protein